MAQHTYETPIRLNKLPDELTAAFPAWVATDAQGARTALFTVEGAADAQGISPSVTITWPDPTPEPAVAAVVAAHDPMTPSAAEELAAADQQAVEAFHAGWVLGQARLGNVGANAIQQQMDTIEAANIGTVAAAAVHIKTLAEAVEDLARQLRVLKRTTAIPADVPDRLGG